MNSKRLASALVALMALAALLVGCGSADSPSLEGTQWLLVALEGAPPLTSTAPPSAEFSADEISGSTGCNHYFGAYEVSGSEITIRDVASTEMACLDPEGVMDQELAFLGTLPAIATYRVEGERLEFLDAGGTVLMAFESAPGAP